MSRRTIAAVGAALLLALPGCLDGDFLTEVPRDFIGPENFYRNGDDAVAAVNGVYASFVSPRNYNTDSYYGRDYFMMVEYPGEVLTTRFSGTHDRGQLDSFSYQPTHAVIANVWGAAYQAIADANAVIDNVPEIPDSRIDPALRSRVVAEARFLRATHYFNLVRLFGDVPLRLNEVRRIENLELPRSPAAEVYQAIIADLQAAAQALPASYAGMPGANTGRATSGAANALLAKVQLQYGAVHGAGNAAFQASADAARQVVNSGRYQLLPSFESVFAINNENNAEIIFSIQNIRVAGMGGRLAQHVAPSNSGLAGANTPGNSFQAEWPFFRDWPDADRRKAGTFLTEYTRPNGQLVRWARTNNSAANTAFGSNGPVPKKYMDPDAGTSAAEEPDYILLRYADVLLTLAEAINEASGPTAEAYNAVNQVRARAGLPPLASGLSRDQFRIAVQMERRYELVLEGHVFFDMQRHWEWAKSRVESHMLMARSVAQGGQAINASPFQSSVPKVITVPIPDHYRFFPIPSAAMASNRLLEQSPGW